MKDSDYATDVWVVEQSLNAASVPATVTDRDSSVPVLVEKAGSAARFAWDEFIYGKIRNPHTRAAYERAIRKSLSHCEVIGKKLAHPTEGCAGGFQGMLQCPMIVGSNKS